jgi:hypothetical protein
MALPEINVLSERHLLEPATKYARSVDLVMHKYTKMQSLGASQNPYYEKPTSHVVRLAFPIKVRRASQGEMRWKHNKNI